MSTKWEKVEKVETPELDRMAKVSVYSNTIGEFIDWLRENKLTICKWRDASGRVRDGDHEPEGFYPDRRSIEQLLADYFKIDLKKIETERRALLDALREDDDTKERPHGR